jgi:predicted nucleotidyltransferase
VRPQVPGAIEKAVAALGLPASFANALARYTATVVNRLQPECVILYGSLAKGTYTDLSDMDLIVIAPWLPDPFMDRLDLLQRLNQGLGPIEALGYTASEFQEMLQRGHVTALEALADGVPVYGDRYFSGLKDIFQDMVRRGLRRSTCSWVLPRPA